MNDYRIVCCAGCDGEGQVIVDTQFDPRSGECWECYERCDYCDGTGGEIIKVKPIEMADLDANPC